MTGYIPESLVPTETPFCSVPTCVGDGTGASVAAFVVVIHPGHWQTGYLLSDGYSRGCEDLAQYTVHTWPFVIVMGYVLGVALVLTPLFYPDQADLRPTLHWGGLVWLVICRSARGHRILIRWVHCLSDGQVYC